MKSYTCARAFQAALIGIAMSGPATLARADIKNFDWSTRPSRRAKRSSRFAPSASPTASLGAVERVRPKMMTVVAIMAGLIPILWSTDTGSEVMQRIAVPMIGGMISSTILTLVVIPSVYALIKGFGLPREPDVAVPLETGISHQASASAQQRSEVAE
jgi:AcrB/AcrD/AcrF family